MADTKHLTDSQALSDLGLSFGASFEQVKTTYRRLAFENHPDRLNPDDPQRLRKTEIFQHASVAYAKLHERHSNGSWDNLGNAPPRPSAAPTRPSSHANAPPLFEFDYASHGNLDELARNFFSSFFKAGLQLLNQNSDLDAGARAMALGFGALFERYKLNDLHRGGLKLRFLSALWAQENKGLLLLSELVCSNAAKLIDPLYGTDLSNTINPSVRAFKPMFANYSFDIYGAIATPAIGHSIDENALAFHRYAASNFHEDTCEAFEFGPKRSQYPSLQTREPFLTLLLRHKPALFGIYYQAGWFNFKHPSYSERGIDPIETISSSKASSRDIALALDKELGLRVACSMLSRWPNGPKAIEGFSALQGSILASPEVLRSIPRDRLPPFLLDETRFLDAFDLAVKETRKLNILRVFSLWAKRLAGQGPHSLDLSIHIFHAASKQDFPAFQNALSNWKARPEASVSDLRLHGVSLAGFIQTLPDPSQDFKDAALRELSYRAGSSALKAPRFSAR